MGAAGSEAIQDAHVSAGYYSLEEAMFESNAIEAHSLGAQQQPVDYPLADVPFYAHWRKSPTLPKSSEARIGQCGAFSEELNNLYVAFGKNSKQTYLTDLVMFDPSTHKFRTVISNLGSGRINASATIVSHYMFIFGGHQESEYTNELLMIDLLTKQVTTVPIDSPAAPSPRSSAVIAFYNRRLIIWGGNNGLSVDSDIHVYDFATQQWKAFETQEEALFFPGFTQKDQYCYIFGSSNTTNMLRLDLAKYTLEALNPSGTGPQTTVNQPSLVACDNYVFCFGGSSTFLYTHLFAYDIVKNWWFVFHIKPAKSIQNLGEVTKLGLFKIPREHGQTAFFVPSERKICYLYGNRMDEELPVYEFTVGKALSFFHERSDLLNMIY